MYLPPNPLKGNREKFDNVQISRKSKVKGQRSKVESQKSKVAVCQIIQNPKLRTRNWFSLQILKSSNLQILKQISATRNPELRTVLYKFKFDFKQQACRSYFVIVIVWIYPIERRIYVFIRVQNICITQW